MPRNRVRAPGEGLQWGRGEKRREEMRKKEKRKEEIGSLHSEAEAAPAHTLKSWKKSRDPGRLYWPLHPVHSETLRIPV